MTNYKQYLERKLHEHGVKFDSSDLANQFVPYFESGQRIIVDTRYGETLRGYVGVTTGWKPVFLLMPRCDSISSSETLSSKDRITGTVNLWR